MTGFNTFGPNGPFGNRQPTTTQTPTTYAPNWKPGGMYNQGNGSTTTPIVQDTKGPAEVVTTQPTTITPPPTQFNTFGANGPFANRQTPAPTEQTNTFGPNGPFGNQSGGKLDYLSPQDMVTDAIAQRAAPRFRPLGGLFGVGYRQ